MTKNNLLDNILQAWHLTKDGETIITPTSTLAFVQKDGHPYVLKTFNKNTDEHLSGHVLDAYQGNKAVKIFCKSENALLLERITPATHLSSLSLEGKDDKATHIFCEIAKELHNQPNIPKDTPTIANFWGEGFNRYLNSSNTQINAALVQKAKQLFFDLANSQSKHVLLHGDLHHNNILLDKKRGWLAIDPKGLIGEAEIEVAALLKNPVDYPEIYTKEAIIHSRIKTISNILNLNQERVIHWAFALTILSCIWLTEIDESPNNWLALALKLEEML